MTLNTYFLHFLLSLTLTDSILAFSFIAAAGDVLKASSILCNALFCSFCS